MMATTSVANQSVTFEIPGEAVPKLRPRVKFGNGRVWTYTPAKSADYEKAVRLMAQVAMRARKPISGPVALYIAVYREPPKSASQKKRIEMIDEGWPVARPDLDNLIKGISDAINGVVFGDDGAVCRIIASKHWGAEPKTIVTVQTL